MDNTIDILEEEEKQDKGFTLIELLIVIVILGILATVVVFAVRGITDQGEESACAADNQTLSVAIEAYYAQYGTAGAPTGPALETALVTSDLLREESQNYNIVAGGTGTPDDLVGVNDCA